MTYRARVSERGQVVIPAELRELTGAIAGSDITFERGADGTIIIRIMEPMEDRLARLHAYAKTKPRLTNLPDDEVIAQGVLERYERSLA